MMLSGSLLTTALRRGIIRSASKWAESIKGMILERSVTKVPRSLFEGRRTGGRMALQGQDEVKREVSEFYTG
jgi:hypothetical protein